MTQDPGDYNRRTVALNALSAALMTEADTFIDQEVARRARLRAAEDLPARLRSQMIGMSSSRALESSPDIPLLCLRAAKAALCLWGADSPAIAPYENDILYYRAFPATAALVAEYEAFKASFG